MHFRLGTQACQYFTQQSRWSFVKVFWRTWYLLITGYKTSRTLKDGWTNVMNNWSFHFQRRLFLTARCARPFLPASSLRVSRLVSASTPQAPFPIWQVSCTYLITTDKTILISCPKVHDSTITYRGPSPWSTEERACRHLCPPWEEVTSAWRLETSKRHEILKYQIKSSKQISRRPNSQ